MFCLDCCSCRKLNLTLSSWFGKYIVCVTSCRVYWLYFIYATYEIMEIKVIVIINTNSRFLFVRNNRMWVGFTWCRCWESEEGRENQLTTMVVLRKMWHLRERRRKMLVLEHIIYSLCNKHVPLTKSEANWTSSGYLVKSRWSGIW